MSSLTPWFESYSPKRRFPLADGTIWQECDPRMCTTLLFPQRRRKGCICFKMIRLELRETLRVHCRSSPSAYQRGMNLLVGLRYLQLGFASSPLRERRGGFQGCERCMCTSLFRRHLARCAVQHPSHSHSHFSFDQEVPLQFIPLA